MQLNRAQICERIPHAGDMCLLDKMLAWDETHIKCSARSHLNPANPLRTGNTLTVMAAIEYAGQAMALHGGLMASESPGGHRPRKGYLASLRNIVVGRPVLDDLPDDLLIEAELLMGDNDSSLYAFTVSTANASLITGRAAVKLLEVMET